ncbi:hypothetical protein GCM10010169_09330 [Micromonospora fulviviridis]|nr:hypothetical protein GCM10010169_09330 [Micromonospora fulviviridis]
MPIGTVGMAAGVAGRYRPCGLPAPYPVAARRRPGEHRPSPNVTGRYRSVALEVIGPGAGGWRPSPTVPGAAARWNPGVNRRETPKTRPVRPGRVFELEEVRKVGERQLM